MGGARIYLKREDLCHTGAHKINNVLGQALLAQRMGKPRIIAETGAGQHGVASATAAALLGLECQVYMGRVDVERQALNVFRMKLLGATVIPVESGSRTLKDAVNEALRDWVTNVRTTYYLLGSVMGPHPYPMMVRDFHRVIGEEARAQARRATGRLPDLLVACVGGGSNAIGLFWPFIDDRRVRIVGVEPGGHGIKSGKHGASLGSGAVGVLHGSMSYVLQNDDGQVAEAHSISAGLDYPGRGARALLLQGHRPLRVRLGDRRGSARGLPGSHTARGHHARARVRPRGRARDAGRRADEEDPDGGGGPVGPRRQGRAHRRRGPRRPAGQRARGQRPRRRPVKAATGRTPSRLDATFAALRARRERALVAYFTAGDPSLALTRQLVVEAARRGADVIELGIPFSDPLADGPVIQRATQRALAAGVTLPRVLELVREMRGEVSVPLVFLTYYNPILAFGLKAFCRTSVEAGIDGVIVADLPPEESGPLRAEAMAAGLDLVHLVAPTSTPERMRKIARASEGFVYMVALTGVTGERTALAARAGPAAARPARDHHQAGVRGLRHRHARAGGPGGPAAPTGSSWARPSCAWSSSTRLAPSCCRGWATSSPG